MSDHPNLLDRLSLKIYPHYLYCGQICQNTGVINIGLIHQSPDTQTAWKVMDYLYLKKGSQFKYLGLAKNLKIKGDIVPTSSVFEIQNPEIDEAKSPQKHISPGDLICVSPGDRSLINPVTSASDIFEKLSDIIAPRLDENSPFAK